MKKIALLSVSDKRGLVPFAKRLVSEKGYELLSTGGTAKLLRDSGLDVTEVGQYTGFPELMEGRLKTLHPRIHGGLLCRRDKEEHLVQAKDNAIGLIDMVVVNLYPFEQTIKKPDCSFEIAIENIDIGGPAMLRSAAKNHASVTVVCDPDDYERVVEKGDDMQLRKELALKVFSHTSRYDQAIARYLGKQKDEPDLDAIAGMPNELNITVRKEMQLRYGENPHQKAALYGGFLECFDQIQGKELSYNNIADISAATYLIGEFERPTVAILKHTNPCGVASADSVSLAWDLAFKTDTKSPFGGIIVMNRTLDAELAEKIKGLFCEVIIAPEFTEEAKELFTAKKNVRLMRAKEVAGASSLLTVKSVLGGVLVQDRDHKPVNAGSFKVVTKRQPTPEEWASMMFGWRVVKHVKSNAIVYAKGERTLGIGAGQMSRVDSSEIAVWKAGQAELSLEGCVVASDAFFPFPDALEAAAKAGAKAVIQPGGSKGDQAVIDAADAHGMAMIFTQCRHFLH